jgi:hypothetical protein
MDQVDLIRRLLALAAPSVGHEALTLAELEPARILLRRKHAKVREAYLTGSRSEIIKDIRDELQGAFSTASPMQNAEPPRAAPFTPHGMCITLAEAAARVALRRSAGASA